MFALRLLAALVAVAPVSAAASPHDAVADALATRLLAPSNAAAVDALCDARIAAATSARLRLERLPARTAPLAVARAYDDALILALSVPYAEANVLRRVHPSAEVRAAADRCGERGQAVLDALQLSPLAYAQLLRARGVPGIAPMIERELADYRRNGVDRDAPTRARIAALRSEIARLGLSFERNVTADETSILLPATAGAGLPQPWIDSHRQPDGSLRITGSGGDAVPVFRFSRDSAARAAAMRLMFSQGHAANRSVLAELLSRRAELARLLGFPDYASYNLADRMAGSPAAAEAFLAAAGAAARERSRGELAAILDRIRRDEPGRASLTLADISYGNRLLQAESQQIDPAEVRRYFRFDRVRDGIFGLARDLFGVEVRPVAAATWAPGVSAYELIEDGRTVGRFFLDPHPRPGKLGSGAWAIFHRLGLAGRVVPEATLVLNVDEGEMDHADVATFLHEFGHLLHHVFAGQGEWAMGAAIQIEPDAIEAPSQLFEEWAWDYDTLRRFAIAEDGTVIPEHLVRRMVAARHLGRGLYEINDLSSAAVSLDFHQSPPAAADLDDAYAASLGRYAAVPEPPGTHGWASFTHLTGYGAGYYAYVWSRALVTDLLTPFRRSGLRDPATAARYRREILAPGGTRPMAELVRAFLGRDWSPEAYRRQVREAGLD